MSTLITKAWTCYGNTSIIDNTLQSVGDYDEEGNCQLLFQVNGENGFFIKSFTLSEPIRRINAYIQDKIVNGTIIRSVGEMTLTETSFFEIDNKAWDNTGDTIGFYIYDPLKIKNNSYVLCADYPVINNIMVFDHIGIKGFDNVVGIRISKAEAGITSLNDDLKSKISQYLKLHPITFLYETIQPIYEVFDPTFELIESNNSIMNINTVPVLNFTVEYPTQVLVTSMIDLQQIRTIGNQVANDKIQIDQSLAEIKTLTVQISNTHTEIQSTLSEITQLKEHIDQQTQKIETLNTTITQELNTIQTIQTEINETYQEINNLKVSIDSSVETTQETLEQMQNNVNTLLAFQSEQVTLNKTNQTSISQLMNFMNAQQTLNTSYTQSIEVLNNKINNLQLPTATSAQIEALFEK